LSEHESISPTFYERNCTNFLAPIKSLTFTSSTKKLCAKLSYIKAMRKMLVKLTPDVNESIEKKNLQEEYFFDDDDGFSNKKVHRQK
jgi:hypothetical protein